MGALDNLGKNIAACRKKAGITQEQLAEQLCVSISSAKSLSLKRSKNG
ncbi:MAG: helix-turn-helix domain-containing protein [Lachnospiraceae bacterium]|nr:helix-turn-helix domain-containing protein [Lachnospiraceae bacterium]